MCFYYVLYLMTFIFFFFFISNLLTFVYDQVYSGKPFEDTALRQIPLAPGSLQFYIFS